MASLFSQSQKAGIEKLLSDVHDTMAREIFVFVEESTTVGTDVDYNPLYNRTKAQTRGVTDKVMTKYCISARIYYPKPHDEERRGDIQLPSSELTCRLKIKQADHELLKIATYVEVDGENYKVDSDPKAVGPFRVTDDKFMEIWLQRVT